MHQVQAALSVRETFADAVDAEVRIPGTYVGNGLSDACRHLTEVETRLERAEALVRQMSVLVPPHLRSWERQTPGATDLASTTAIDFGTRPDTGSGTSGKRDEVHRDQNIPLPKQNSDDSNDESDDSNTKTDSNSEDSEPSQVNKLKACWKRNKA